MENIISISVIEAFGELIGEKDGIKYFFVAPENGYYKIAEGSTEAELVDEEAVKEFMPPNEDEE